MNQILSLEINIGGLNIDSGSPGDIILSKRDVRIESFVSAFKKFCVARDVFMTEKIRIIAELKKMGVNTRKMVCRLWDNESVKTRLFDILQTADPHMTVKLMNLRVEEFKFQILNHFNSNAANPARRAKRPRVDGAVVNPEQSNNANTTIDSPLVAGTGQTSEQAGPEGTQEITLLARLSELFPITLYDLRDFDMNSLQTERTLEILNEVDNITHDSPMEVVDDYSSVSDASQEYGIISGQSNGESSAGQPIENFTANFLDLLKIGFRKIETISDDYVAAMNTTTGCCSFVGGTHHCTFKTSLRILYYSIQIQMLVNENDKINKSVRALEMGSGPMLLAWMLETCGFPTVAVDLEEYVQGFYDTYISSNAFPPEIITVMKKISMVGSDLRTWDFICNFSHIFDLIGCAETNDTTIRLLDSSNCVCVLFRRIWREHYDILTNLGFKGKSLPDCRYHGGKIIKTFHLFYR